MHLLTVIAGPNGAGKSTAISQLNPSGEVVNVDDIARSLAGTVSNRNLRAARLALARIDELLDDRADFNFETTLSSNHALSVMRAAKLAGYRVELVYIILRSPELHVARVKQRVAQGGHDIPPDVIRRRYDRSLANLPSAVQLSDQVVIYDNTEPILQTVVRRNGSETTFNALAQWRAVDAELARTIARSL